MKSVKEHDQEELKERTNKNKISSDIISSSGSVFFNKQ